MITSSQSRLAVIYSYRKATDVDHSPITSEDLGNMTVSIPIPEGQQTGDYFLVAAIPYLAGVSHPPERWECQSWS